MKVFNEEHEWLEVEGDIAKVGISKYAVEQLGDITFLELPEVDADITSGASVAFVESVKAASDIYAPASGTVTEINEDLLDTPEVLNEEAENVWIFKMKLSDVSDLDNLMDGDSYAKFINTL